MQKRLRRRSFIKACSYGAAGVAAGVANPGRSGIATGFPANDTIRVGVIGTGGRAQRALMPAAAQVPGVELVAVCDVYDQRTRAALALSRPGAFSTRDHRAILAREDIDGFFNAKRKVTRDIVHPVDIHFAGEVLEVHYRRELA